MRGLIIGILVLALTSACSDADTLGGDPPIEFTITGQLIYENQIDELLSEKCALCHAIPRPDIAPGNVPPDLDLTTYHTRLSGDQVIRGADALGTWLFEGILDQPITKFADTSNPRQMPLDYATQLTESEKQALRDWSRLGLPTQTPEPTGGDANLGADLYFETCATCHADGTGIQVGEQFLGPAYRRNAVTVAKIKSMWLHKHYVNNPRELSDEEALNLKAFILDSLVLID